MSDPAAERRMLLVMTVAVEGGLVLLALFLGWLLQRSPLVTLVWEGHAVLLGVAATVPMLAAFVVMVRWPIGPLRQLKRFTEETLVPMLAPLTRWISLMASLSLRSALPRWKPPMPIQETFSLVWPNVR